MTPTLANQPTFLVINGEPLLFGSLGMRLSVACVKGIVRSAIASESPSQGIEVVGKSSKDLDFSDLPDVSQDLQETNPDRLIIAVAKLSEIVTVIVKTGAE